MRPYLFSIIVPTFNRANEIRELIGSFQNQTLPHNQFEVLLVDDGSDDDTLQQIDRSIQQVDFRIRCFQRQHEGPGPARNFGMAQAEGEFFLFIDSDCIADQHWLTYIAQAVEKEQPQAFGGPDGVLPEFTPLQKAIDYAMTSFLTTGGMRGHASKRLAKFYPRSYNMGIHRSIFENLGGMNNLRHGQDLEFSRRIIASGVKVIYIPNAIVYHRRRTSLRKFFRQIFNWGVARINLAKIDQAILEPLHFMPAVGTLGYFLLILLTPFHPIFRYCWLIATGIGLGLMIIIFINAIRRYHDFRTALLAPIVSLTQIVAYGLGFTTNYIRRIILGRGEYTGFTKKYYK
jgi:glycosyltransferase involved in cell wall biosynthesis